MDQSSRRPSVNEGNWEALIKRVAGGDEDAFATLYDQTCPLLYGLAVRMLGHPAAAEEVLCAAYQQVWRQALADDERAGAPFTWLF